MRNTNIIKDKNRYMVVYWETAIFEKVDNKIILRTQMAVKKVSLTTTRKINQAFEELNIPFLAYNKEKKFYVVNLVTDEIFNDRRDLSSGYVKDNVLMVLGEI